MTFDATYVATRRQLRGVAESLIAGPSAGDDHHPTPYAYIAPWTTRTGALRNAPFGALCPLDPAHDVDALADRIVDFFDRGRRELQHDER